MPPKIEPPTMKKPSAGFLSRMRSPRRPSNPADDDPKSPQNRKLAAKQQYKVYQENKAHEKHVRELAEQNRKLETKRARAEAWLLKKGYTKEAAREHAAATVLQVYTALCNLPVCCYIHCSLRISATFEPPCPSPRPHTTPARPRCTTAPTVRSVVFGSHPCAADKQRAGAAGRLARC